MLLLGIDLGTSSVKVSVVDAQSQHAVATATYPDTETGIISIKHGWAEQSPDLWWEQVKQAILKCHALGRYNPADIAAIGIAYQMHGLVLVDKDQHVLRNSIIWCDSRAVETGDKAFHEIGEQQCLNHLLNAPGNFTASKLGWVKQHERVIYDRIYKAMLPGDFIAMKMTGEITTTVSALSEGIFWDFRKNEVSRDILRYFGFDPSILPAVLPVFATHGELKETVAARLFLKAGIPVAYKAGDQPNNAFSLNVLQPGEVATTAGTSGVIYGVADELFYDHQSRINRFAHVNHRDTRKRIGILLCINGTGIFNRWIKNIAGSHLTYTGLNEAASRVPVGSEGLMAFPFGNGAERLFNNRLIGAGFSHIDLNVHTLGHMARAVQEGIAFSFRYGLDIMRANGIRPTVIRAGKANLFLSEVFTQSFTSVNDVALEFYEGDGSFGAAIGAGIGAGMYADAESALKQRKPVGVSEPVSVNLYDELYENWKEGLERQLRQEMPAGEPVIPD